MIEKYNILKADSVTALVDMQKAYLSGFPGYKVVFKRYFLSDSSQVASLPVELGAISYIVQPPLGGDTCGVLIHIASDANVEYYNGTTVVTADGVVQVWTANMVSSLEGSQAQTHEILSEYESLLDRYGMTVADNCVRTWFFVHDIDNNYSGMVRARREDFMRIGLTPQTHYIASTGICGSPCEEGSVVQLDACAMKGPFTQRYLYAPTHLNPTYEYGVTFERGVKLNFSSHSQVLISGTASINNKGEVVHVGDVSAQTERMLDNVKALTDEAEVGWEKISYILVYLRNPEDYDLVEPVFRKNFPKVPYIICQAPVCRPDWLIEMECVLVD